MLNRQEYELAERMPEVRGALVMMGAQWPVAHLSHLALGTLLSTLSRLFATPTPITVGVTIVKSFQRFVPCQLKGSTMSTFDLHAAGVLAIYLIDGRCLFPSGYL